MQGARFDKLKRQRKSVADNTKCKKLITIIKRKYVLALSNIPSWPTITGFEFKNQKPKNMSLNPKWVQL